MKITQETKLALSLAGEYRVLSEILLRGLNASLTMGNAKGVDILVFNNQNKFIKIEVKTSKNGKNFVTNYFPKYSTESLNDPNVWVLFLPKELNVKLDNDRFYILTHSEIRHLQLIMNKGKETKKGKGVDNITLKLLEEQGIHVNNWELIKNVLNHI